jgi:diaminopimelate epimerase
MWDAYLQGGFLADVTWIRGLCRRSHGIGADGVLIVQRSQHPEAAFRVHIFNADGSRVPFCGNGLQCALAFAATLGLIHQEALIEVEGSLVRCVWTRPLARILLPIPDPPLPCTVHCRDHTHTVYRMDVGVPHGVVLVNDLSTVNVASTGRMVRYDPLFAPQGINVHFLELGTLNIRSYERGIEKISQACGSGALAAGCVLWHLYPNTRSSVHMRAPGGDLQVTRHFNAIELRGTPCYVFQGTVPDLIP